MKVKTDSSQTVTLVKRSVEETEEFTYLGRVLTTTGGTEQDVEARLGKDITVYRAMDKLWKSKIIGRATQVKIFNSNVKAVLLYVSESWPITLRMTVELQVFIYKMFAKYS